MNASTNAVRNFKDAQQQITYWIGDYNDPRSHSKLGAHPKRSLCWDSAFDFGSKTAATLSNPWGHFLNHLGFKCMANKFCTGKKGKHDIAPMVRGAFLEALNIMKQKHGKTFSEIIADWMEKHPLAVLNAVSKFTVGETKNEHRGNPDQPFTVPLQSTQELIERVIREADNKQKPTPRSQ